MSTPTSPRLPKLTRSRQNSDESTMPALPVVGKNAEAPLQHGQQQPGPGTFHSFELEGPFVRADFHRQQMSQANDVIGQLDAQVSDLKSKLLRREQDYASLIKNIQVERVEFAVIERQSEALQKSNIDLTARCINLENEKEKLQQKIKALEAELHELKLEHEKKIRTNEDKINDLLRRFNTFTNVVESNSERNSSEMSDFARRCNEAAQKTGKEKEATGL